VAFIVPGIGINSKFKEEKFEANSKEEIQNLKHSPVIE